MALPPSIAPRNVATSTLVASPLKYYPPLQHVSRVEAQLPPKLTTAMLSESSSLVSNISIQKLDFTTLPSFRRIITILLPIRYPDKFFSEILSDASVAALSRVSVWHDRPRPGKRKRSADKEDVRDIEVCEAKVVGGIRCRLEPVPVSPGQSPSTQQQLYIQTLVLLSPYRAQGIANRLLDTVVTEAIRNHNNVTSIYAHVWEANLEGLEWYRRRGFLVEDKMLEGYYRKLKPGGARIVRRQVGIGDHLRAQSLELDQNPKEKFSSQTTEQSGLPGVVAKTLVGE